MDFKSLPQAQNQTKLAIRPQANSSVLSDDFKAELTALLLGNNKRKAVADVLSHALNTKISKEVAVVVWDLLQEFILLECQVKGHCRLNKLGRFEVEDVKAKVFTSYLHGKDNPMYVDIKASKLLHFKMYDSVKEALSNAQAQSTAPSSDAQQ